MQIDTHIIDFINNTSDFDDDDKTKSLIEGKYALQKIRQNCHYCPKELKIECLTVIWRRVIGRVSYSLAI